MTLSACGLLSSRGSIASLALRPARRSCLRLTHVVASMSPRLDSRWGGSFRGHFGVYFHHGPVTRNLPEESIMARLLEKSWAFTENDLALGVQMLHHARNKYPWFEMQTLYPFDK